MYYFVIGVNLSRAICFKPYDTILICSWSNPTDQEYIYFGLACNISMIALFNFCKFFNKLSK